MNDSYLPLAAEVEKNRFGINSEICSIQATGVRSRAGQRALQAAKRRTRDMTISCYPSQYIIIFILM
jgi:hypothetical protein